MSEPYGYTIFCDDIRQEVGGKLSFMGAYNGDLHILTGEPFTLPKLAAGMTVVVPEGIQITEPIAFALLHEVDGETNELVRAVAEGYELPTSAPAGRIIRVSLNFQLSPFLVDREAILRARAYVNGQEVKIGALALHLGPPAGFDTDNPAAETAG
ncbi:hypothetical protein [Devosia sp.]|uniref:hypothetical protein n=1 Tax=Devosia sp. TaxID=1871048 RepID=UPI001AC4204B|nr:hypothetical protein [Devosia sp.]MBN9332975.1 hypothetical protein [Devosia sp.]